MKRHTELLLIALFCAIASLVIAGEFNSKIIPSTGDALILNVPEQHYLRIRTFTQEGGSQRGVVAVTANGGTSNVLAATLIDQGPSPSPGPDASIAPEFMKKALIAGPAQITIAPVSGATLFVTYIRQAEPTPTATPTVTPTVTPTPTITPTPTATP